MPEQEREFTIKLTAREVVAMFGNVMVGVTTSFEIGSVPDSKEVMDELVRQLRRIDPPSATGILKLWGLRGRLTDQERLAAELDASMLG